MARSRRERNARDDEREEGGENPGFFGSVFGRIGSVMKGFFGGIFSGTLIWGTVAFIVQATGLAGPIAKAIGGDELAAKVANWGKTADGVDNIGQRILISAGIGAAMGGAGGAAKGLISPGGGPIGGIVSLGMALVTAAVVVGTAVNHNETTRPSTPMPPRPAVPPVRPTA